MKKHPRPLLVVPASVLMKGRMNHIMQRANGFWRHTPAAAWVIMLAVAMFALPGPGLALQNPVIPTAAQTQPATTQSAAPMSFDGTIVDKATGKPIEGAKVIVHQLGKRKGDRYESVAPETEHVTDARGKYRFTLPAEQVAQEPYLEMEVHHPKYASLTGTGYGLNLIRRDLELGQKPWFARIELFPGEEVTGVVLSSDGKPLADVDVEYACVAGPYEMRYISSDRADDTVKTDDQGRFRFNAIKGATVTDVFARSDSHPDVYLGVGERRGDVGTLRFQDGVVVTGTLLDADGKPLPNVRAELSQQRPAAVRPSISRRYATSDAQGKLSFQPVQPDPYVLRVDPPAGAPRVAAAFLPKEITVVAGQQEPIEYRAVPHVTIRLQYVDSAGNPTRGHGMHLFARNDGGIPFGAEGAIDERGTIEIVAPKGVTGAEISLMTDPFSALRYRRGAGGELRAGSPIELGTLDADIPDLFVVRFKAPVLTVRATSADGQPVVEPQILYPNGTVPKMRGKWINGLKGDVSFERQDDGAWRTSQLLPDQPFLLTVDADGYDSQSQQLTLAEGETRTINLVLRRSMTRPASKQPR